MNQRRLALLAIVLEIAIALPLAFVLNLWQDEVYTLHSTAFGVGRSIHEAIVFEQNAPLYFVIVALWRMLSASYVWIRCFSVLCAALAVALVPSIVRRYAPGVPPGTAAIVVALNPFLIWAAAEARLYAFVILLSAVLLVTFYDGFIAAPVKRRAQVAYALACIAAEYTQYYLLFLIAAQGCALLARRTWRQFAAYVVAVGVAAIVFVPMLRVIPEQAASFRGPYDGPSTALQVLAFAIPYISIYVLPIVDFAFHRWLYVAALVAAGAGIWALRPDLRRNGHALLASITVVTFVLFWLALTASHELASRRHMALLFLPVMLALFSLFTYVRTAARPRAIAVLSTVLVPVYLVALVAAYRPLAKPGDWKRVSAYIMQHETRGEPILVFEAEPEIAFAQYYHGVNRLVPIPRGVSYDHYDIGEFVLRNRAQIERALARVPGRKDHLWVVHVGKCREVNVDFGCGVLYGFLDSKYQRQSDRSFYQSDVSLWQARAAAVSAR